MSDESNLRKRLPVIFKSKELTKDFFEMLRQELVKKEASISTFRKLVESDRAPYAPQWRAVKVFYETFLKFVEDYQGSYRLLVYMLEGIIENERENTDQLINGVAQSLAKSSGEVAQKISNDLEELRKRALSEEDTKTLRWIRDYLQHGGQDL